MISVKCIFAFSMISFGFLQYSAPSPIHFGFWWSLRLALCKRNDSFSSSDLGIEFMPLHMRHNKCARPQISQKRIRLPLKEVQYFAKVQRCSYNMLQSLFISTYRFIIAVTIKSIVQSNRLINLSMSIKIELSHKLVNFTLNPKYKRSIKRVDLSYSYLRC